MRFAILGILLMCCLNLSSQETAPINMLSIPHGCYIVSAPASFSEMPKERMGVWPGTLRALIDGGSPHGWKSPLNPQYPIEFVFELSEECFIDKIVFFSEGGNELRSPRYVRVEMATSNSEEFRTVLVKEIRQMERTTEFNFEVVKARKIKVSIISNFGGAHVEIKEIEAWGTFVDPNPEPFNLTGDWESLWGVFSLKHHKGHVEGHFLHGKGRFTGKLNRRVMTCNWMDDISKGTFVATVSGEGNRMHGILE